MTTKAKTKKEVYWRCKKCGDEIYRFLVIGQYDKESSQFVDWLEKNPFEEEHYWK